jgi:hypothetical protein
VTLSGDEVPSVEPSAPMGRPTGMKRALWILVLAAALSTATGAVVPDRALAGCAVAVVWHDTSYFQYFGRGQAPSAEPGQRLDGAVTPGCNDTGGSTPAPTPVGARAIRGVPTAVAILSHGSILIAPGYFPQAAGFPLARPGAPVQDETRNCRLGAPLTLSGRARPDTGRLNLGDVRSSRPVRLSGHEFIDLVVDGRTRLTGLTRDGIPYVGNGQAVRIEGQFCRVPGSVGPVVIARRIAAAGRVVPSSTAEDILGGGWRGGGGAGWQFGGVGWTAATLVVLAAVALYLARARRRKSPASGAG